MSVQTVELAGRKFVIMPEKAYRALEAKAALKVVSSNGQNGGRNGRQTKGRRPTAQELGDIAESRRRIKKPGRSTLADVRKRLGL